MKTTADLATAASLVAIHGADDALRTNPAPAIAALVNALRCPVTARAFLGLALARLDPAAEVTPSHSGNGAVVTLVGRAPVTILAREVAGRIADALKDGSAARFHRRCFFAT